MDPTLVYNIQPGPIWDWRVAVDLFAGGVGVGAFLFTFALSRFGDRRYQRLAQTAAIRDLLADEAKSAAEFGEPDLEWDALGPNEAESVAELEEPDYLGWAV